jgi:uncharacterized protein (DUF1501 family)
MSFPRREFLKNSLMGTALLSLAPAMPDLLRAAVPAPKRRDQRDTVLVVLELPGGNDGLNTIVPFDDDDYGRNRSTLRLKPGEVIKIDTHLGFHPRMSAFANLLKEGRLSVIQGVGYPHPQGGHDESMRIWQTADQVGYAGAQTGWIGRAIDSAYSPEEACSPALYLGETRLPFAFHAERAIVPSMHRLDQLILRDAPGAEAGQSQRWLGRAAKSGPPTDDALLKFLRRSAAAACAGSAKIESVAKTPPAAKVEYPRFQLAGVLRTIAQLIRTDRSIRLYFTSHGGGDIGGYDTHAAQRDNHAALVHQLSESVAAFVADLAADKTLDRVLLVTYSEFGRTLVENGRRGTDHGSAAPVFLAGGKVRGGIVGPHPSLSVLEGGGQKHHTDFRRVYATLLDRWLGWDSRASLGKKYEPLDVLT